MQRVSNEAALRAALTGRRAMVFFGASWCGFCRAFAPLFERAAAASPGLHPVIAELDDEESPLWDLFGIEVVPTVLFFDEGALVRRLDGRPGVGVSERDLQRALSELGACVTSP